MSSSGMYFTRDQLEKSQSRKDGITFEKEKEFRRKTCLFIEFVGKKLNIPKSTQGVAQTFLQRFFARHSFKAHDRLIIAATCVFLAGKAEETRVSLQDIMMRYFQATKQPNPDKQMKSDLKERILVSERVLLHTIAFQLSVSLPYKHIFRLSMVVAGKEDEKTRKLVVKTAWTFVGDSLKTDLCLQYHEASIAAACMYMAITYLRFKNGGQGTQSNDWWMNPAPGVHLDTDGLQSICLQVLDVYALLISKKAAQMAVPGAKPNGDEPIDHEGIRKHVLQMTPPPVPDNGTEVEKSEERTNVEDAGGHDGATQAHGERDAKRVKIEH